MTNPPSSGPAGSSDPAERLVGMLSPQAIDALLADAEAAGTAIDGPDGLLAKMTKAVLERALDVEIADHLGYEPGDPAGNGSGNSRNGHGRKTVHTSAGPVELEVPRDRNGSFTPVIVPKRKRRLGNVEDMISSCTPGACPPGTSPPTWPRSTAPRCRRRRSPGSRTWSPRRSPPGRTGRSTRSIRSCTSTRSGSRAPAPRGGGDKKRRPPPRAA